MKSYTTKIATTLRLRSRWSGAFSMPANAAVVLGGADGWEVSYGGFINLFYTQSDFGTEDSAHLNQGLLPSFHTMTVKTPRSQRPHGHRPDYLRSGQLLPRKAAV